MNSSFRIVISLLFAVFLAIPLRAAVLDRLEASVNGDIILLSDVRHFRKTASLRGQLDPLFSGTTLSRRGGDASSRDIVQFLVDDSLVQQSFPVKDAEVEQEINNIQASNHMNRETLKAALKQQGFSFHDYFELIRSSLAKRNLLDRDIRTKVHISDDDVKNYFYNQYSGKSALSYRIKLITISRNSYRSAAAAQDTARKALQSVEGGDSFEEVAQRYSDAPNASSGGDLGFLSEEEIAPEIRQQLKKLKVGNVSPIFGDPNSILFIVKLSDLRSGQEDRLAQMTDEIRNRLAAQEYQRQIELWLERQRQDAFIHLAGGI